MTEQTELKRLAFNHAQIISETGSEMRALAERPDLVASATRVLEKRLRDLANGMESAEKSALFDALAAEHPDFDFSKTRSLFGL